MGRAAFQKIGIVIAVAYCVAVALFFAREGGVYAPIAVFSASSPPQTDSAKLRIPRLGINAHIQTTGLTSDGAIGIPTNYTDVAWFSGSAKLGESGNSIIVGHRDTRIFAPGVFRNLNSLTVGDDMYVFDATGKKSHFRVVDKKTYYENTNLLSEIVGHTDYPRLTLITCEGNWDQSIKRYDQRLVIFAELVR